MQWNSTELTKEVQYDLFGWYYLLKRKLKQQPQDKEEIERHICGFMENYIVLKKMQKRWNPEWNERCEYSKIKTLYKVVVD